MGNCQAIDAATLVIQHPNGKVEKLYWPVTASEIMRMNPGHYVALLITTTLYHHQTTNNKTEENTGNKTIVVTNDQHKKTSSVTSRIKNTAATPTTSNNHHNNNNSVRVTRVKLLRPTDTLALGHVYRLITTQEVMKGLVAKKQAKLKKHGVEVTPIERGAATTKCQLIVDQVNNKHERHNRSSRTATNTAAAAAKSKGSSSWQPSLQSISEAAS